MLFPRSAAVVLLLFSARLAIAEPPVSDGKYEPTAENLAARAEFQDDKFGVFIHWGVYSVLGRGEWVMNNEGIPVAEYDKVAERFNPAGYDPDQWCRLFKQAGAKYVTITSKHHDGFCLWDSEQTDWDVVDHSPYRKDLLKPLAEACERHGLKLFFYHSQLDWHHPDYYPRGRTGRKSNRPEEGDFDRYVNSMNAQLSELLDGDYGKVSGIWFDGWWDQKSKHLGKPNAAPSETQVDWRLRETYDLIHRLQPGCLVGANHHVAPFPGEDFQMFEKDLPGQNTTGFSEDSIIGRLPLETCDTINGAWGYNAGDHNYKSTEQLIGYLVRAAGSNANFLLNIGPKPDGTIQPEFAERLTAIGAWLEENGQSIYGTRGGPVAPQDWGVSTKRGSTIYLHVLTPPEADEDGWVTLSGTAGVKLTGLKRLVGSPVESKQSDTGELVVQLPEQEGVDTILVAAGE